MSTDDRHAPRFSNRATSPVARVRWTQRNSVLTLIEKHAATSVYPSVPVSYARTARSRSAVGYGLGEHEIDHSYITNSSDY
jgi:hypothetical protein